MCLFTNDILICCGPEVHKKYLLRDCAVPAATTPSPIFNVLKTNMISSYVASFALWYGFRM